MDERIIIVLREKSEFCLKFNFDLYYYFFEIGFDLWNRSGKIVYIMFNSYIKVRSGEVMMRYFIDNLLVEIIIDYKDEMKFEGVIIYMVISVFFIGNKVLWVKNNKGINLVKVIYRDLMEKYNYMIYSYDFLIEF